MLSFLHIITCGQRDCLKMFGKNLCWKMSIFISSHHLFWHGEAGRNSLGQRNSFGIFIKAASGKCQPPQCIVIQGHCHYLVTDRSGGVKDQQWITYLICFCPAHAFLRARVVTGWSNCDRSISSFLKGGQSHQFTHCTTQESALVGIIKTVTVS